VSRLARIHSRARARTHTQTQRHVLKPNVLWDGRTRTAKEDGGIGKLDFPLLSDLSKDISRKFNVLVENPEDEHYGVTMRGTFVIDPQVSPKSAAMHPSRGFLRWQI